MREQRDGGVVGSLRHRSRLVAGIFAITAVAIAAVASRYGEGPTEPPREASALDAASALTEAAGERGPEEAPERESAAVSDTAAGDGEQTAVAAVAWVSPQARSPLASSPAPERVAKPEAVRGIYVGSWSAGSARRLAQLIALADGTEINAFVIDIKDATGEVSYATQVPLAQQVGADRKPRIGDVRAMLAKLREHGIYPIARIVAFKDPVLADARPEWAIQRADGSVWQDDKGIRWVDAFNAEVWAYNIELAREAVALGFAEVQWDYVRFPDAPQSYMSQAVYPARAGRTMSKGIRQFIVRSREELGEYDVPITADVFGITTSAFADVGIGQLWEDLADVTDVLLPMVYPSHYPRGTWGFPVPNAAPYQIVHKALKHGVDRSVDIPNAATIRPWLQAFDLGAPVYTPEYVRAQIDAVYDAGLTEWILWNPSARYDAGSLVTAEGRSPWFAGRGQHLYPPPAPEPEPALDVDTIPIGAPADTIY